MPNCKKCKQRIKAASQHCQTCNSYFHPSCARLFILNKSESVCCVSSFSELNSQVDTARTDHNIGESIAMPGGNHNVPWPLQSASTPTGPPLASLPSNWENLSSPDQLSLMMQHILTINSKVSAVEHQLTTLSATVAQHGDALNYLNNEIEKVKSSREPQQGRQSTVYPEIIVTGVPSTIQLQPKQIMARIMTHLHQEDHISDIFSTRPFNSKSRVSEVGSSSAVPVPVIAFVVRFKTNVVRDGIIEERRKMGKITVADIFPECQNGNFNIYLNELLPNKMYALLKQTKIIAKDANYKIVWVRAGEIFVRKENGTDVIQIKSEVDLQKIS